MASWLRRLFSDTDRPHQQRAKPSLGQTPRSVPRERNLGGSEVDRFLASVRALGHPEHPILSSNYSTSSRVPCTDLIPFLSERLHAGDVGSVKILMRRVIEGNPGLGIGPDWIDESIDQIVAAPFEKYVSFPTQDALVELRAIFIVASKSGGGREFLISENIARYMAWILFARQPHWSSGTEQLAKKANSWIRKIAKDTPYWQDYGRLRPPTAQPIAIPDDLQTILASLTPAARLHFMYATEKGGGSLPTLTSYEIRSMGIDTTATSEEILSSGLMIRSSSPDVIESAFTKQELLNFCETHRTNFKKSWTKAKLVESLQASGSETLQQIAADNYLAAPDYTRFPEISMLAHAANEHETGFKLLCFA